MARGTERVAVTGGGGFIGQALVLDQAGRGREVRSLDVRHAAALPGKLSPTPERIDGTILDRGDLARAFEGCRTIFHLASAHLEVRASESHFRSVNVEGTRCVVDAAAAAGARRVVHVSTVGVYGQMAGEPFTEESPTLPTIPYERTKLAGERVAREAAAGHGIELVIARPSWVYGSGCRRTRKIFNAIRKGRFLMAGDGRIRRDGIHVDDCVAGLDLCAHRPEAAGETFLLVSGDAPPLREWVEAIAEDQGARPPRLRIPVPPMWCLGLGLEVVFRLVGKDAPFSRRSLKFFTNATVFDSDKIQRILGFQRRIPWRDGVRRTAEEILANPH